MPLKLNVGLCKKIGEPNYGSRGASVNVELELDSALVNQPDNLKGKIRQAFNSLRSALAEELNGLGSHQPPANSTNSQQNGSVYHAGNGSAPASADGPPAVRPATASQIKAIHAIARSRQIDIGLFLRDRFQRQRPEELTIKEASGAIDDLKRKE